MGVGVPYKVQGTRYPVFAQGPSEPQSQECWANLDREFNEDACKQFRSMASKGGQRRGLC